MQINRCLLRLDAALRLDLNSSPVRARNPPRTRPDRGRSSDRRYRLVLRSEAQFASRSPSSNEQLPVQRRPEARLIRTGLGQVRTGRVLGRECQDQRGSDRSAPPSSLRPSRVGTNSSALFDFREILRIMTFRLWPRPLPLRLRVPSHAVAFTSAPSAISWSARLPVEALPMSPLHGTDVCRCVTRRAVCVFKCESKSIKDVVLQRWRPDVAHEAFSSHPYSC